MTGWGRGFRQAYKSTLKDLKISEKNEVYMENNTGSRMDPWGTSILKIVSVNVSFGNSTCDVPLVK